MKRILVLERNTFGVLMVDDLTEEGYEVIHVKDEGSALREINSGSRIDFVISSGVGWKECYEYALKMYGERNLLFCTASSEVLEELRSRGFNVFEKPFIMKDLIECVKRCCPP